MVTGQSYKLIAITAIAQVYLGYLGMVRKQVKAERFEAYPTLMVPPAGLPGQTINEEVK